MAYIGNTPALQYITHAKQTFTPNGSTVAFTLSQPVANENELEVFVNNVRQEPGSGKAYTASGTTLTMSEAPNTGDGFYCIYQGKATQTVTPGNGTVSNAHLAGSIDLTTKVTGVLPEANSFPNTPAFKVTLSSNQVIAHDTLTRVAFDTEEYDTDNAFASNVFTVPSGKGGKYFFEFHTLFDDFDDTQTGMMYIEIDGVKAVGSLMQIASSTSTVNVTLHFAGVLTVTAGQTVEVVAKNFSGSNQELRSADTYFAGHKLIGV